MNKLTRLSALAAFAVGLGLAGSAQAALVSITGGTSIGIPSSNNTLPLAGIGVAAVNGGSIIRNGTLNITSPDVTLTLYDVGSESGWKDKIRLGNTSGSMLYDYDDFVAGTGGVHSPFQLVGSVTQNAGVADIEFWRRTSSSHVFQVENGNSPRQMSGGGIASIAFAYLSDANQIVNYATNRILVMLDDGYSSTSRQGLRRLRRDPGGLDARAAAGGCVAAALGSRRVRRRRSASQGRDRLKSRAE